jgi:DNA-binding NarL/FixJ family response regulator
LTAELAPSLIILGTELADESGWLTCDKLLKRHSSQKVILVADYWTPENRRFASFVGAAAVVHREAGFQALAEEIDGPAALLTVASAD